MDRFPSTEDRDSPKGSALGRNNRSGQGSARLATSGRRARRQSPLLPHSARSPLGTGKNEEGRTRSERKGRRKENRNPSANRRGFRSVQKTAYIPQNQRPHRT